MRFINVWDPEANVPGPLRQQRSPLVRYLRCGNGPGAFDQFDGEGVSACDEDPAQAEGSDIECADWLQTESGAIPVAHRVEVANRES